MITVLSLTDNYTVVTSNGTEEIGTHLRDLIIAPQTYKAASIISDGSITLDAPRTAVGVSYQDVSVGGLDIVGPRGATILQETDTINFQAYSGTPLIISVMAGVPLILPSLPNQSFLPANFNNSTVYNNNISAMGEFIGRSVIRNFAKVKIKPLPFKADMNLLQQARDLFSDLRKGPFFLKHDAPDETEYCYYGWTETEPKLSYDGELNYMSLEIDMTVYGYSIKPLSPPIEIQDIVLARPIV